MTSHVMFPPGLKANRKRVGQGGSLLCLGGMGEAGGGWGSAGGSQSYSLG